MSRRIYVDVSFENKDEAGRILGSAYKYDRILKCPYVESPESYSKIKHLENNDGYSSKQKHGGNYHLQFQAYLESMGFHTGSQSIHFDGKKHYLYRGNSKDVRGSYIAYDNGRPNATVIDYQEHYQQDGQNLLKWKFNGEIDPSIKFSKADIAQKQYDNFVEQSAAKREAAKKSKELFVSEESVAETTPYLERKNIKCYGAKITDDQSLHVPIKTIDGKIVNIQTIYPDGSKYFQSEAQVSGAFHQIGFIRERDIIVLCEGFATGATLAEQLRRPVICALTANNLVPVAKEIQKKYPNNKIAIAADNDRFKKNAPVHKNKGILKAEEAGELLGDKLYAILIPSFDYRSKEGVDWNDKYLDYGKEEMIKDIESQGLKPKRERKKKQSDYEQVNSNLKELNPQPDLMQKNEKLNSFISNFEKKLRNDFQRYNPITERREFLEQSKKQVFLKDLKSFPHKDHLNHVLEQNKINTIEDQENILSNEIYNFTHYYQSQNLENRLNYESQGDEITLRNTEGASTLHPDRTDGVISTEERIRNKSIAQANTPVTQPKRRNRI